MFTAGAPDLAAHPAAIAEGSHPTVTAADEHAVTVSCHTLLLLLDSPECCMRCCVLPITCHVSHAYSGPRNLQSCFCAEYHPACFES